MKKLILFLACMTTAIALVAGEDPHYTVINVPDGNTLEIMSDLGDRFNVLLYGIDAPDSGQNFALEAKAKLEQMSMGKVVTIAESGKDRNGTMIARVSIGDDDLSMRMIRAGLAWTNTNDEELEAAKDHVRSQDLGLWIEESPTPPWMYRRHQSMARAKSM